jgi:hypothetical protein
MNVRDSEFDRLLAEWLEDDVFVAPATPVDAAVEFARSHRRRRDWLDWFRRDAMPTRATMGLRPIAILAAIAVLLALGGGGAALLASRPDSTPMPTATADTPTLSPGPTATPLGVRPLPPFGGGRLDPGRYAVEVPDSDVTATITIEDGWTTGGWYIMDPPAFTKQVSFWTVENVHQDWCDPESLPGRAIGPTVDDLVAALDAQQNTDMSAAAEVEVNGFAGKRVRMQFSDRVLCNDTDLLPYFVTPSGPGRDMEPGRVDTLWILDVDGNRVVICTSLQDRDDTVAATSVAAVIDSMELTAN